jgi:hypothetical protein
LTREAAREAFAALVVSAGGFTTVNAFLPLSLGGTTKVANIYTRESDLDVLSADLKNNFHTFNVDCLVLRQGTAADEDNLDALHEIIVGVCVANPSNANWSHLELEGPTEPRFVQDAGTQYRLERHKVKVKLTS